MLPQAVAVLAAALCGFGLILWVAANWAASGRFGRFGLLAAAVAVMGAGAVLRPGLRVPLGLLAFLASGGLLAYFGQTYQTGADSWQLFALWAALGLPLALGVRSDMLWLPWVLVAATALSLASKTWPGGGGLEAPLLAWLGWLALAVGLATPLQQWSGAGPWSARLALTLATAAVTTTALATLFANKTPEHYLLALCLLGAAAWLFATRAAFDLYALSVLGLGLDVLLVCGLARLLFEVGNVGADSLLLLGLAAAGLLAGTVAAILALARRRGAGGQA